MDKNADTYETMTPKSLYTEGIWNAFPCHCLSLFLEIAFSCPPGHHCHSKTSPAAPSTPA